MRKQLVVMGRPFGFIELKTAVLHLDDRDYDRKTDSFSLPSKLVITMLYNGVRELEINHKTDERRVSDSDEYMKLSDDTIESKNNIESRRVVGEYNLSLREFIKYSSVSVWGKIRKNTYRTMDYELILSCPKDKMKTTKTSDNDGLRLYQTSLE